MQEVNKEFITGVSEYSVIATAADGDVGIRLIKDLRPGLVVLDVYMPKKDGIKTLHEIRKQKLGSGVVIVSA
ncbi:response regulator, partial [Lysinibacillus sp. D4A1_S13]|uniref:response regulator n=1 Tax=Lysinibacillus sp. D4A1_S13 TaxID=2941228 RepID=UPI0020C0CA04